jgi:hypothetical protein
MNNDKLDKLCEFMAQRTLLDLKKQELVDTILTPDLKKQIADIEIEFQLKAMAVDENIETLKAEITTETLAQKETQRGTYLMCSWVKGREGGWDSAMLKGFAMAYPEIMAAKKPDGEPTVSFKKTK